MNCIVLKLKKAYARCSVLAAKIMVFTSNYSAIMREMNNEKYIDWQSCTQPRRVNNILEPQFTTTLNPLNDRIRHATVACQPTMIGS